MIKEILKGMLKTFAMVTTGSLIAAMIIICIANGLETIETAILWEILVVSAACALANIVLCITEKYRILMIIIHYILVNGIVLGMGRLFDWFQFQNIWQAIFVVLIIAAVYAVILIVSMLNTKKEAEKLNEKLKNRQQF